MASLQARHLFDVTGLVGPSIDLRDDAGLGRLVVPVLGGTFEGERLRGTVLPVGADWLMMGKEFNRIDVRISLRTDDGADILMTYQGVHNVGKDVRARLAAGEEVDPSSYYFRTAPLYETADPRYAWLTGILSVGYGVRQRDGVLYRVYEVL
ncbi:DUF3237 domain-containing protein [Alsobacter sp. R-9]